MYFFVSENIFTFNSGTEHAQAKRTKLFNRFDYGAIYVTRNYNRFLERDRQAIGLAAKDVLNMYDFYQEITEEPHHDQTVRTLESLPFDEYHLISKGADYSTINHAGREIGRIDIMPGTVGLVNAISWYDLFGNTTVRENYDWRGFKSSIDYFNPDGSLAGQKFLNRQGIPVLEVTHMAVQGKMYPTVFTLLNHQGADYQFSSEDELFRFFLNELMLISPKSTLISDRRSLDGVVADIQNADSKWAYLHDVHTVQANKALKGKLFDVYKTALVDRVDDFDGIMVPSHGQQKDLLARFPKLNVQVAPDGFIKSDVLESTPKTVGERIPGRVVFVGRISPEKRPEQAIRVFSKVVAAMPEATLEFHGYPANGTIIADLKEQAAREGIQDNIIFGDYVTGNDLSQIYQQARVLINTSRGEGYGLSLIEAQGYGLPAVVYDINYGPAEIIEDGQNGFVLKADATKEMADKILLLLSDENLWIDMSQRAYQAAQVYSAEKMIKVWEDVLP